MMTTVAERATVAPCEGCGQDVLSKFNTDQRRVVLDAQTVPGGLYVIDAQGRARRRGLVELFRAQIDAHETPGYDVHECVPVPWYAR